MKKPKQCAFGFFFQNDVIRPSMDGKYDEYLKVEE